jgi:hypothetical protein
MAHYKEINYKQGIFIPVVFSDQVIEGTFEVAVSHLLDNGHIVVKDLIKKHRETDKKEEKEVYKEKISKYQKKVDKIVKFINQNYSKPGKRISEIQSNITDNESARMKSSHGVIQGYTGEAKR